jgi:hypothetical protein
VIALISKKLIGAVLILTLSVFSFSTGFHTSAIEKIPNFGVMKVSDTRQAYFVTNVNGKVKKVKMSERDSIIIARLFNTNEYADIYMNSQLTMKTTTPYIEVRVKPDRIINIYCSTSGFVFLDQKKQYYVEQKNFLVFFSYCRKIYESKTGKSNLSNQKYKQVIFKTKDLLDGLKKAKVNYKILRTAQSDMFSTTVKEISLYDEEICIHEFKDNIDMEIAAMRVRPDGFGIATVGEFEWINLPHFFKKGNIIVQYIGDSEKLVKAIETIMGKQYAGGNIVRGLGNLRLFRIDSINIEDDKYTTDESKGEIVAYLNSIKANLIDDPVLGKELAPLGGTPLVVNIECKNGQEVKKEIICLYNAQYLTYSAYDKYNKLIYRRYYTPELNLKYELENLCNDINRDKMNHIPLDIENIKSEGIDSISVTNFISMTKTYTDDVELAR